MQNRNKKILHPGRQAGRQAGGGKGYWEKAGSMIYVIDDVVILVYDVFCFG